MTRKEFAEKVDEHYAEMRRLAGAAREIIKGFLEERGNMSEKELYGDEEDHDWCWLINNDSRLVSIEMKDGEIWVEHFDEYFKVDKLDWVTPSDAIEIADFLCRTFDAE